MKALASVKAVVLSQRSLWDRDLQMDSPLLEGVEKVGFAALHGVLKGCVRLVRNPVADESLPGARRQALADTVRPQFCMKEQEIARSVRRAPMRLLNLCLRAAGPCPHARCNRKAGNSRAGRLVCTRARRIKLNRVGLCMYPRRWSRQVGRQVTERAVRQHLLTSSEE